MCSTQASLIEEEASNNSLLWSRWRYRVPSITSSRQVVILERFLLRRPSGELIGHPAEVFG